MLFPNITIVAVLIEFVLLIMYIYVYFPPTLYLQNTAFTHLS